MTVAVIHTCVLWTDMWCVCSMFPCCTSSLCGAHIGLVSAFCHPSALALASTHSFSTWYYALHLLYISIWYISDKFCSAA